MQSLSESNKVEPPRLQIESTGKAEETEAALQVGASAGAAPQTPAGEAISPAPHSDLTALCKKLEAFETPRWIIDPCAGTGVIPAVCEARNLGVHAFDIFYWRELVPEAMKLGGYIGVADFFTWGGSLQGKTVIMNPPFSKACEFVDRCRELGARKIICFQRQAWRESAGRREWWEKNPPARVWVCGARASCWRFDLIGTEKAEKSGTATSHAWYVWERGHKGAELTGAIYPRAEERST
jgi:hypothetical protein